jgi:surface polysaccharide O-acyltransferase-like enzyme
MFRIGAINMKQTKERLSNLDLLRIVAMLIIIFHHITVHCVVNQMQDINGYGSVFAKPLFFKKLFLLDYGAIFGPLGNAIFIMISGYFLVSKGSSVNVGKSAKKLLSQLLIATAFLVSISVFICLKKIHFFDAINLSYFHTGCWFVGYYFIIIVIGKLFLNNWLQTLDEKRYLLFLFALCAIVQLSYSRYILDNFIVDLDVITNGIFIYSTGGYIRKFNPLQKMHTFVIMLSLIIVNLLIPLSTFITRTCAINKYLSGPQNESFVQPLYSIENYNLIIFTICLLIFELFRRIKLKHSKLISYLGSATFMVYLIHDNPLFYAIWSKNNWCKLLSESPVQFILLALKWTGITFSIGVIVYSVYIIMCKIIALFINPKNNTFQE